MPLPRSGARKILSDSVQFKMELDQLTDLVEYSRAQFGENQTEWPWYYTTEGVDPYTLQRDDLISVTWTDRNAGMLFVLKHGADWHIC